MRTTKWFLASALALGLLGCPQAEDCAVAGDEDGNGLADCEDDACSAEPACQLPAEFCSDGIDNDENGAIDCDDAFCADDPACGSLGVCGDGAINVPGEPCDGNDLGGKDCVSEGFDAGVLSCNADCSLNTAACTDCGNGIVEGNEACDDGNITNGDGCDTNCVIELPNSCDNPTPAVVGANTGDTSTTQNAVQASNNGIVKNCPAGGGNGNEVVFSFTPAITGIITFTLNTATDQGIHVRTACNDAATELGCEDQFFPPNNQDEVLTLSVTGGVPLFVFVDAFDISTDGPFTLTIAVQ